MLLYTKIINGERKIYASATGFPAETDNEVIYKDADGDVITLNAKDFYVDDGAHGIIRKSDGKYVAVYADSINVIPGGDWTPKAKVLTAITIAKKPAKLNYIVGESFDLTGIVVKGIYESGDKELLTSFTTSPEDEYVFLASDISEAKEVIVSYTEGSVTKTATFVIKVIAAE